MFRKIVSSIILLLALVAVPRVVVAQDGISRKQQEKKLEKQAKVDKKEKAKKEKFDRKRHLSLQDKATRKRLKRHNKRADRNGSDPHRDSFFQRTFGW